MSVMKRVQTVKATSPATAGNAVLGIISGLDRYAYFVVDALLAGATGGLLDVYLQRKVVEADGTTRWVDWLHFPQLTAGATAQNYTATPTASAGINAVGAGTSPTLAANTFIGGHPGAEVRVLAVAGSGTSAGASQSVTINAFGANE